MSSSWSPSTLAQVSDWPVDTVAAAVRADDGSWHTHGDSSRIFELASVTKLLAAVGMLVAVEEGAVELDQELTPPGGGATVRHLLAHAGGVGFDSRELEREPGKRRIYSSAGFDIIADAIAAEAEMPFSEYLDQAVFQPLGMASSVLDGSAGHGARSSVDDLMAFVDEVLAPTILHPESVDEAFTVQFPGLDGVVPGYGMQRPADWGLGFEIFGKPDSKQGLWFGASMPEDVAGHFGQAGTFVWLHRPTGRAAIALTDRAFGDWAKPLWTDFNDALWRELAEHAD
ncbi:MAG: serine hydrolase domain-containing protein [Corynebacterium sp.]|uniref:serine hydrolase domain-containing protein n=1 Tax=Corynebacterium sp. TaxID=1720 RepID=UPI0026DC9455|nr:serine hydrolase domain-containing protein [Corynebacterium sp.]MDO5029733.1 serine hydrolase domain-containing protein [Corynebacterium sp.]